MGGTRWLAPGRMAWRPFKPTSHTNLNSFSSPLARKAGHLKASWDKAEAPVLSARRLSVALGSTEMGFMTLGAAPPWSLCSPPGALWLFHFPTCPECQLQAR